MSAFKPDRLVMHALHGQGRVVSDLGGTVVVRFGAHLHQIEARELTVVRSFHDSLQGTTTDGSLGLLAKAQAHLIRSVNDQWGVFSRSRVALLPHQLWVCRQVTRTWPTRWLIADDVGLGKTIEAGLILEPLLASGRVRRLLVLAPARLVPQWRERLKDMFDIRLQEYSASQDKGRISFWETASQVVASFHTLRQDHALGRLMDAEPWDMVLVDEAHHFQAQERSTTQTYNLLAELEEAGLIRSLVLLTGTPHRGKDYGFLALMQLLRHDLFDPRRQIGPQLGNLQLAMIRNNKALVTDLQGNPLFKPVTTKAINYTYSPEEARFYNTMSEFILDGRAYAMTLSGRQQTARMLLLVALQKLAASSIAAIGSALEKRRAMLAKAISEQLPNDIDLEEDSLDETAMLEERRPLEWNLLIMKDEVGRLEELIHLAQTLPRESKVDRLIELIETRLAAGESLLLFTEYKATQALAYSALENKFGAGCVGFINGDGSLAVARPDGSASFQTYSREVAASDFNSGRIRFLISTEAGGEGIDLQHRCSTLVHIDVPWNPMRLHQRVGRINRYGQKNAVRVFLLRNPETVEARIWELLEEKLTKIQAALSASMEEAEDITQLVIGMAGNTFFDELYVKGYLAPKESLSSWFDSNTMEFGGQNAVETVRSLLGSVSRYDFQSAGPEIPRVDLQDLEPFFRNAMQYLGRRVISSEEGLSVATPENWRGSIEFRSRYDRLVFDRGLPSDQALTRLIGVGHPLLDRAVDELISEQIHIGYVANLQNPVLLAKVEDEVTGTDVTVHEVVLAVEVQPDGSFEILRDWEALLHINKSEPTHNRDNTQPLSQLSTLEASIAWLQQEVSMLELPFRRPKVSPLLALLP